MSATAVIDTADWIVVVPILSSVDQALDLSGTRLWATVAQTFGGPPIMTISLEQGGLSFVPATSSAAAYLLLSIPVAGRAWRVNRVTTVFIDLMRQPDPYNLDSVEWLGRTELRVHPGADSGGIAVEATSPVLIPAQPYEQRVMGSPLNLGLQGLPGAGVPAFDPIADEGKSLTVVNGALAWV